MRSRAVLRVAVVAVTGLLVTSCGGDESTTVTPTTVTPTTVAPTTVTPTTLAPTTVTPTTLAPTTVAPATVAPTTVVPSTSVPATVSCGVRGGTGEQRDDFPMRMSGLVGSDIRTGAHDCSERIVIELQVSDFPVASPFPGWWVRYADGPITLGQSDDQFVDLRGDETLLVTMNAWMWYPDVTSYDGPTQVFPTNVEHILELYLVDNWEGQHTWAVGVDERRNVEVTVLDDPPRLVVDLQR